jgi:hypothetical protein
MMWPMHHHCSPPMSGCCMPQPGWIFYPVYVPVHCPPPAQECCEEECECECDELTVPEQIDANGDKKSDALVGGHDDAHLTLEYLVEAGAADTTVAVTAVQPDGTSSTWTDTGAGVGFHVQEKFLVVKPGTKLTLEVKDIKVTARLRWCETICC